MFFVADVRDIRDQWVINKWGTKCRLMGFRILPAAFHIHVA